MVNAPVGLYYLRVHFGDAPEAERRKVREHLERYCGQDTEGMIWIVEALRKLSRPSQTPSVAAAYARYPFSHSKKEEASRQ
jgi:hypothetical protein